MANPTYTVPVLTLALVGIAALWDIRTGRIPNYVTFTAIGLGLTLSVIGWGPAGLKDSILGLLVGGSLLFIPFALGGIGPGDLKLLAAVGALNGFAFVTRAFLCSAVAGGLIAVVFAVTSCATPKSGMVGLVAGFQSRGKLSLKQSFPYGLAIMAGTVAAYAVR